MAGCLAKPRSVMPLVGAWPLRARVAFSTNWLIISAVRLLASSAPEASSGLAPTICGSVSLTRSPRLSPRMTSTKRCSRTGSTKISEPGTSIFARILQTSTQVSVDGRPARRSVMVPDASSVQKLPRMATSRGPTWKLMPRASKMPRPMRNSRGS